MDDDILDHVLTAEGGYVDHPADRGGPTRFGVTAATLGRARALGRPATPAEVRALDASEARAIYQRLFIDQPGFGAIGDGRLKLLAVDSAVLFGPSQAVRWLQAAIGVAVDGVLGPASAKGLSAAMGESGAGACRKLLGLRLNRIAAIVAANPSQIVFLKGWIARTVALMQEIAL